jgi:hypothetical protein
MRLLDGCVLAWNSELLSRASNLWDIMLFSSKQISEIAMVNGRSCKAESIGSQGQSSFQYQAAQISLEVNRKKDVED